jgi:hypothetical protein
MDFMPDKEFHPIFDRVSRKVSLKGAGTPAEINKQLTKAIKEEKKKKRMIKKAIRNGHISRSAASGWLRKISNDIKDTKQLIFAGFARRTIDEAITRPRGKVALTLRYGRKKAKDILLERARKRIGPMHLRRRSKGRW